MGICYSSGWCRDDGTCCRTCENDWHLLAAILAGLLLSITLAVLHGELCSNPDKVLAEFEVDDKKLVVQKLEPPPKNRLTEVVRIKGSDQTSVMLELGSVPQSNDSGQDLTN